MRIPSRGRPVAYYEVDGVPLFHNLGRHRTRSAITGNSFWAMDGGLAFPGVWKPGEWFTMSIPVDLLPRDADGALKMGDRLSFRNFENSARGNFGSTICGWKASAGATAGWIRELRRPGIATSGHAPGIK